MKILSSKVHSKTNGFSIYKLEVEYSSWFRKKTGIIFAKVYPKFYEGEQIEIDVTIIGSVPGVPYWPLVSEYKYQYIVHNSEEW